MSQIKRVQKTHHWHHVPIYSQQVCSLHQLTLKYVCVYVSDYFSSVLLKTLWKFKFIHKIKHAFKLYLIWILPPPLTSLLSPSSAPASSPPQPPMVTIFHPYLYALCHGTHLGYFYFLAFTQTLPFMHISDQMSYL